MNHFAMFFQPIILWTDALFYLLLLVACVFVVYITRKPLLRQNWGRVFADPLASFSIIILLFYFVIAILDSLHFHPALLPLPDGRIFYSTQVRSVLDVFLSPLGVRAEATYSAPFAIAFVSLDSLQLTTILFMAIGTGLLIWLIMVSSCVALCAYTARQAFWQQLLLQVHGKTYVAWRSIFLALGLLIVTATLCLELSKYYHILGTNLVGQDVFYQSLKSIRTGLIIGTLTTLLMLPFALVLGTVAGYFSGWIDDIIQYIYTTLSAIPGVLLITAAILAMQIFMQNHISWFPDPATRADVRLLILCAILGVTSWIELCRLLRGETLKLREIDFIQAAVIMGVPSYKIIARHIFPNVAHIILITMVLDFSGLVLAEAVLSYLGVGVDPLTISWGNMINSARMELARDPVVWWPLTGAFIFMFVLVLCANIFADVVRDVFDPRRTDSG